MNSYERIYNLLTEWVDPEEHEAAITKKKGPAAGKVAKATRTRRILSLRPKIDREMFDVIKSLGGKGAQRGTDTPESMRRAHTQGPGPLGSGSGRGPRTRRSQADREGWNK